MRAELANVGNRRLFFQKLIPCRVLGDAKDFNFMIDELISFDVTCHLIIVVPLTRLEKFVMFSYLVAYC